MSLWWLSFHENIRFSKTDSEYQGKPCPLEKTTNVFLDPPKKMHVTFVGYSWNIQGTFLYSVFPEHYLGVFPRMSYWTFFKYSGNIKSKCSANIPRTYICPVGDYNRKTNENEKKITDHDHEKYITTPEFNKLTSENFAARSPQAYLGSKYDISVLVKKTNFHKKLKKLNKNVTLNKTKYVLVGNELNEL